MARAETATRKPAPKTGTKANGTAPKPATKDAKEVAPAPAPQPEGPSIKEFAVSNAMAPVGMTWAAKLAQKAGGKKDDDKPASAAPAPPRQAADSETTTTPAAATTTTTPAAAPAASKADDEPKPSTTATTTTTTTAPTTSAAALWSGYNAKRSGGDKSSSATPATTTATPAAKPAAATKAPAKAAAKPTEQSVDEPLEAPGADVPDSWEAEAATVVASVKAAGVAFDEQVQGVVVVKESMYAGAPRAAITQDSVDKASKRYSQQLDSVVLPAKAASLINTALFKFSGLQVTTPPPAGLPSITPAAEAPAKPAAKSPAVAPVSQPVPAAAAPVAASPQKPVAVPAAAPVLPQQDALPTTATTPSMMGTNASWADGDVDLNGPKHLPQNGVASLQSVEDSKLLNRSKWGIASGPVPAGAAPAPVPGPTPAMPPVGTMPPMSQPLTFGDGAPFDRTGFGSASTSSYNPFSSSPSFGNQRQPNGHAAPKKNPSTVGSKGGRGGGAQFQPPAHASKPVPPAMQGGKGGMQATQPSTYGYNPMLPNWNSQSNYGWGRGLPNWNQQPFYNSYQFYGGYPMMYGYPGYGDEQYYGGRGQQFGGYDRSLPHSNYTNYFMQPSGMGGRKQN